MAAFLAATVIPLSLISLIFYRINANTSHDKIMDAIQLTHKQIVQQIEARFNQVERVADTLQYYMYNLTLDEQVSISERMDTFSSLRTNVSSLESSFDFFHICIFLDSDSMFSKEGLMFYGLDRLDEFGLSEEDLINSETTAFWIYVPDQAYPFMVNQSYASINAINCIRVLRNITDHSLEYVYLICINQTEFTELLSSAYEDTAITGYLIDENGRTIAASDSDSEEAEDFLLTDAQLEKIRSSESFDDDNAIYQSTLLDNGWIYVTRISQAYIRTNTRSYVLTFLVVLSLMILFAMLVVILLTRNLTRRITLLSDSASTVNFNENQFHVSTIDYIDTKPEKYFDEVDHLVVTYNKMIRMIYENIDHITRLRAQEASLKYQLLQSLINPHFLYNVLDSIIACNKIGQTETANEMIMNLTKFYRMTLRKSNKLITIRDELEIARLYMELESICHGSNFSWEISMEDGIENFMICKFTLQPFIENSILHGIQGFQQKLHIKIDIRYGEDTIQIFITDDGQGIPPEKLQELRESLATKQADTEKHFGICNVNARISSELFGYGFIEIDSEQDKGTSVKIEFQQILPE
jgi:two-component system sensor histidine kinase YesM